MPALIPYQHDDKGTDNRCFQTRTMILFKGQNMNPSTGFCRSASETMRANPLYEREEN